MRKPDFIIVGAPKSGTTALNHYLSQHPEIHMAPKEMHFFGSDLYSSTYLRNRDEYLSHFQKVAPQKIAGESSVYYLFSKTAASEIISFSPAAKIIAILRDPLEVIYSQFFQLRYNGYEDLSTVAEALAAEPIRKNGQHLRDGIPGIHQFQYREIVRYSNQVDRYFRAFPKAQVHIILYDDFKANTARVYKDTLRFLGVDTAFRPKFTIVNANKIPRFQTLNYLLARPPAPLRSIARQLVPLSILKLSKHALMRANTRYLPRKPMPEAIRKQLREEFREEVHNLASLIGRDLSGWMEDSPNVES